MAELEVSVVLTKENAQTKSSFFTGSGFSTWYYQLQCTRFYIICGKEIPKTRMNFESGFNNFGNIFFTIAGNICGNRR